MQKSACMYNDSICMNIHLHVNTAKNAFWSYYHIWVIACICGYLDDLCVCGVMWILHGSKFCSIKFLASYKSRNRNRKWDKTKWNKPVLRARYFTHQTNTLHCSPCSNSPDNTADRAARTVYSGWRLRGAYRKKCETILC